LRAGYGDVAGCSDALAAAPAERNAGRGSDYETAAPGIRGARIEASGLSPPVRDERNALRDNMLQIRNKLTSPSRPIHRLRGRHERMPESSGSSRDSASRRAD
jgi:hypothetical protein